MKIHGQKIYLKEGLRDDNYEIFLRWFTDIDVIKYLSFAKRALKFKTTEELENFFAELTDALRFEVYSNNNVLIGCIALSRFKNDECDFGIIIGEKDYWNKGIGEEVLRIILSYGFSKLNLKKISLSVSEYHNKAIHLYKKLGFKAIKIKPNARTVFHNNGWVQSGTVIMELTYPNGLSEPISLPDK